MPLVSTALPPLRINDIERFWRYVDKRGPDECWPWKASTNKWGYGKINFGGRLYGAHRLAYFLYSGKDPVSLLVCHHCDCRLCVNAAHLFVGSHADNSADMVRKGRNASVPKLRHEAHPFAKLTTKKVRQIRKLYFNGRTQYQLADDFRVSRPTIASVVRGKTWRGI